MKIKTRILLFFFLLLTGSLLRAQVMIEDTTKAEPFLKAKKFHSRGYVGAEGNFSQLLVNKVGFNLGFSLNWVVNHRYVVSAKYHTITSQNNIQSYVEPSLPSTEIPLIHHYAGLGFSYILFHKKKFSLQPEISGGWALSRYSVDTLHRARSDYGMIIPALYGTYNASPYFQFGIGVRYNAAIGCKLGDLKSKEMSGVGGLIFIRIGQFN